MMKSRYVSAVDAALATVPGMVEQTAPGRYRVALAGVCVTAWVDDSWLVMQSPALGETSAAAMLARNSMLPALVKFALDGSGNPMICAQIPIADLTGSAPLIRSTCEGIATAAADSPAPIGIPVTPPDLQGLCAEARWDFTTRSDGSLAVELECHGAFAQASLRAHGEGVHLSVELADCLPCSPESESAIALLLLIAGGAVRLARPVLEQGGEMRTPRFEAVFSTIPSAAELSHALCALSVAFAACSEEVRVLWDPNVASEYLALLTPPIGCVQSVNK